jgi:hypothetical protein
MKPKKLESLLFYSQHPDGTPDILAEHGGCPVISVLLCLLKYLFAAEDMFKCRERSGRQICGYGAVLGLDGAFVGTKRQESLKDLSMIRYEVNIEMTF